MNYGRLEEVLAKAAEQASAGKGAERHADGQRFEDQPIMWIEREFKSFSSVRRSRRSTRASGLNPMRQRENCWERSTTWRLRSSLLRPRRGGCRISRRPFRRLTHRALIAISNSGRIA